MALINGTSVAIAVALVAASLLYSAETNLPALRIATSTPDWGDKLNHFIISVGPNAKAMAQETSTSSKNGHITGRNLDGTMSLITDDGRIISLGEDDQGDKDIVQLHGSASEVAAALSLKSGVTSAAATGDFIAVATSLKQSEIQNLTSGVVTEDALLSIEMAYPDLKLDPLGDRQWARENWGARSQAEGDDGTSGADVGGTEAVSLARGAGVTIAVLDSGVDLTHPDLQGQMWTNSHEICGNHIDDDNNGYIDDCNGWDFGDNDGDVSPSGSGAMLDHGTHVTGIIAASDTNGIGIAGLAPDAKVMPLKISSGDRIPLSAAIAAIRYAMDNGAKIINASWNTTGISSYDALPLNLMINETLLRDVVVAVAAGNNGKDIGNMDIYPAIQGTRSTYPNVISVAATTNDDTLASFSNYGIYKKDNEAYDNTAYKGVAIAAPGERILSTTPNGGYSYLSGTSMAAPHVAAAVALLMSQNPEMNPSRARDRLMATADELKSLHGKVRSGRLNVAAALGSRDFKVTYLSDNTANPIDWGKPAAEHSFRFQMPQEIVQPDMTIGVRTLLMQPNGTGGYTPYDVSGICLGVTSSWAKWCADSYGAEPSPFLSAWPKEFWMPQLTGDGLVLRIRANFAPSLYALVFRPTIWSPEEQKRIPIANAQVVYLDMTGDGASLSPRPKTAERLGDSWTTAPVVGGASTTSSTAAMKSPSPTTTRPVASTPKPGTPSTPGTSGAQPTPTTTQTATASLPSEFPGGPPVQMPSGGTGGTPPPGWNENAPPAGQLPGVLPLPEQGPTPQTPSAPSQTAPSTSLAPAPVQTPQTTSTTVTPYPTEPSPTTSVPENTAPLEPIHSGSWEITEITPRSSGQRGGSLVYIQGDFPNPSIAKVRFDNVLATVVSATPQQLIAIAPSYRPGLSSISVFTTTGIEMTANNIYSFTSEQTTETQDPPTPSAPSTTSTTLLDPSDDTNYINDEIAFEDQDFDDIYGGQGNKWNIPPDPWLGPVPSIGLPINGPVEGSMRWFPDGDQWYTGYTSVSDDDLLAKEVVPDGGSLARCDGNVCTGISLFSNKVGSSIALQMRRPYDKSTLSTMCDLSTKHCSSDLITSDKIRNNGGIL